MIIGRKYEQQRLKEAFASEESEFVAVYGRRRVGKTFLVRETFQYDLTFQHSGLAQSDKKQQLKTTIAMRRLPGHTIMTIGSMATPQSKGH